MHANFFVLHFVKKALISLKTGCIAIQCRL